MTRREAFEKGTSVIIKLSKLHSVSTNHIKLLNQSTLDLVVLSLSQSRDSVKSSIDYIGSSDAHRNRDRESVLTIMSQ